jgi:hypothetical protein
LAQTQFAQGPDAAAVASALDVAAVSVQQLCVPPDKAAGGGLEIPVTIQSAPRTLRLHPHSVRSENFRVLVAAGEGALQPAVPPPPCTWRGELVEDGASVAAASVLDGQLSAIVRTGDGEIWAIEPLGKAAAGAQVEPYAVYRLADIKSGTGRCGVEGLPAALPIQGGFEAAPPPNTPAFPEIAFDADVEFYQQNGSVAATVSRIETIMNGVDAIYQAEVNINYTITDIIVRTAEPDP